MNSKIFQILLTWYPPYLGTGIRVKHISEDYRHTLVEMRMHFFNRNYMGTHFGGSLYAMCDPFYALMLIQILGAEYIVWDKSATIEFVSPGKGNVYADFRVEEPLIQDIREKTAEGAKYLPRLTVEIRDERKTLVARVHKTLYVRKKSSGRIYRKPLMIRMAEMISALMEGIERFKPIQIRK